MKKFAAMLITPVRSIAANFFIISKSSQNCRILFPRREVPDLRPALEHISEITN
jgi:hypothetical protein